MTARTRVTSFEIAQIVGVSQPTVSRALRGDRNVSEETRRRVVEVARELNYTIDMNASRLRTQRTQTIALVVVCRPGESRANVNPFYLSLLGCIAAAASDHGYGLIVSFQDAEGTLFGDYEDSRQADGTIVLGSGQNTAAWDYFAKVRQRGKSILGWASPHDGLPSMSSDNRQGGKLATQHLASIGCKRVAFAGPVGTPQNQFEARYRGYLDAMASLGLEPIFAPVTARQTREEQGYEAVTALLEAGEAFDGLFAANDFIALGAMQCLKERGFAVPGDVAIVGFDGIRAGTYSDPPLSTIEQDYEAAGVLLVRNIVAMIEGGDLLEAEVPVLLHVRGSSVAG